MLKTEKLRRKPEAIIKSFEMDPEKKAIYVEGQNDRLFLEYIFEDQIKEETIFFEIETVDIPNIENGGNRMRLIDFATKIDNSLAKIRCYLDADYSRILKEIIPKTVILTDFKDLEAYLYDKIYLNKFIKIGLKTDKITPDLLLDEISKVRDIAILRICSQENKLDLPFQRTNQNFSRYYKYGSGLDLTKYLSALLQNCEKRHSRTVIQTLFDTTKEKYKLEEIRNILHGKDVLEIIKEIAGNLNLKKDNIDLVFWMSFNKFDIKKYIQLGEIQKFLN